MSNPVLSKVADGIRTVTLNRPARLNAMNHELVRATAEAFAEASADDATRVVIFTGAGRAFCAGDDLKERGPATEAASREAIDAIQEVTRQIVLGDKFVIGAINGWAVGGGFEWAVNCDLSIWAESARGFFPEMELGAFVTGAVTTLLPRLVGLAKAKEMLLLGTRYPSAELHQLGLAWRVVPDAQLIAEARSTAARIASMPPRAVTDLKRVMGRAAFADIETAQALETDATVRSFLDPETVTRMASFPDRDR